MRFLLCGLCFFAAGALRADVAWADSPDFTLDTVDRPAELGGVAWADSPNFTLDTVRRPVAIGSASWGDSRGFVLDTRPYLGPFFVGGIGDSGVFTLDTRMAASPGLIAGQLALYPTVAYTQAPNSLVLSVRAVDPLYGEVKTGAFQWSLERPGQGALQAGTGYFNHERQAWIGGGPIEGGLAAGNYLVRYHVTSERGRQGTAELPLTVGAPTVTVQGLVLDSSSETPLWGAQVALFAASGPQGLWTLANTQFRGVIPPLAAILNAIQPIRPIITTGPDGAFSWADVPVGETYLLVALLPGYQQQQSVTFFANAAGVVVRMLHLTRLENTLAQYAGQVRRVRQQVEALLDANAEVMGNMGRRFAEDDIYSAEPDWFSLAGDLTSAATGGFASLLKAQGELLKAGFKPALKEVFKASAVELAKELGRQVDSLLYETIETWALSNTFPTEALGYRQSRLDDYFRTLLQAHDSEFLARAMAQPLGDGFSRGRYHEFEARFRESLAKVISGQTRYLPSPDPARGIYGFSLREMARGYELLSQSLGALGTADTGLTGVQFLGSALVIAGGVTTLAGGAGAPVLGIGLALNEGAGFAKDAAFVAQLGLKLKMAMHFATTVTVTYPWDNGYAVNSFRDFSSALRQEASNPFYFHEDNRFDAELEVELPKSFWPFPDGTLWAIGGPLPGLDSAFGFAQVTVRDRSSVAAGPRQVSARCVSYSLWSPITFENLVNFVTGGDTTIRTSTDVRGPEPIPVGGQGRFVVPYRGHTRNLISQLIPHYLVVESAIGPWRTATAYRPFYVLAPGEILRPISLAGAVPLTRGDIKTAASGRSGRIGLSDLRRVSTHSAPLVENALSAENRSLQASFLVETNVWAVDLRLFAPSDAEVALLVTDRQGRRLGYSTDEGLVRRELTGSVTDMSQRPISLRLLEPPLGETYTVTVALLNPGPQSVRVGLFKEIVPYTDALLAAQPSRVVWDAATGIRPAISLTVGEASQQRPLASVTATLTNLARVGGGATIALLTNDTQNLGDLGAGQVKNLSWPLLVDPETPPGKYVSSIKLTSDQTAELEVPVVALIRRSNQVASLLGGTNTVSGDPRADLVLGADGTADSWVHLPRGFLVVHGSLGLAPASTNLQNLAVDIGADGQPDWSISGLLDVGVLVSDLESAFNQWITAHASEPDAVPVPVRLTGNTGERVTLGGLQLYLEAVRNALRAPRVRPDGQVEFELLAQPGFRYRLEVSNDLTQWAPLATLVATQEIIPVRDPSAAVSQARFYRAVLE